MKGSNEVALVGFPNSGKTTLFNQLTGMKQRVGNWPGVTVEKKLGQCQLSKQLTVDVIDLPGIQSLLVTDEDYALDAAISRQYILQQQPRFMINVIDAMAFERDLYLTLELLELGLPLIIFVTKTHVADKRGIVIHAGKLAKQLQVPVYCIDDMDNDEILTVLTQHFQTPPVTDSALLLQTLPDLIKTKLNDFSIAPGLALHCIEGDVFLPKELKLQSASLPTSELELDLVIADWRFGTAHEVASNVIEQTPVLFNSKQSLIDNVALHRFLGVPLFLTVMYMLFTVSIGMGSLFQPVFDFFSQTVFIDWPLYWMQQWHFPNVLMALVAGVGKGINTTFTFMPVLFFMFFSLAFLEQSGYMVRAAVIIDRVMRQLGLSGKAFIPLIIGLGCNVPAVMATRTLDNPRDRILTSLMSPFMSCGARLAIYAVFVSLFFVDNAYTIVFSLYLIGVVVAIMTGWLVRHSLLKGREKPLVMELPRYQMPRLGFLVSHGLSRVKLFIKRTARIIIPLCVLLTLLSRLDLHGQWLDEDISQSCLAYLGRALTFIFQPMGVTEDNWPAVIGLLSGMVAKEVVVGTLNTLYYMPDFVQLAAPSFIDLVTGIWDAFVGQLDSFINWLGHPWASMLNSGEFKSEAGAALVQNFQTKSAAYAYLLFVLLYVPCLSTIATIQREINRFWAWFSVVWSTVVAYVLAVTIYQLLTMQAHMLQSIITISQFILLVAIIAMILKFYLSKIQNVVV